ncbi:hypothetical protein OG607_31365 [Streptomyces sp. NBC_01537]|uniref:hypothetical protein n=1 Tax=Streptomyces sp. NBC_01537 TaxID=2903896 RepID=UPI00386EF41E
MTDGDGVPIGTPKFTSQFDTNVGNFAALQKALRAAGLLMILDAGVVIRRPAQSPE